MSVRSKRAWRRSAFLEVTNLRMVVDGYPGFLVEVFLEQVMVSTNDVRPGMALDLDGSIFTIIKYEHVKPGKGKAFVRMKLKNVETGQVLDKTFRADEDVQQAIIDRAEHQYLYHDDYGYHFMKVDDYSQIALSADEVGDAANFLSDSLSVILALYRGKPIGVDLPASVVMEVVYAEPAVKGNTVSGATKFVEVQTGYKLQVPLFIEQGDRIKVDTRTGEYMTRE